MQLRLVSEPAPEAMTNTTSAYDDKDISTQHNQTQKRNFTFPILSDTQTEEARAANLQHTNPSIHIRAFPAHTPEQNIVPSADQGKKCTREIETVEKSTCSTMNPHPSPQGPVEAPASTALQLCKHRQTNEAGNKRRAEYEIC
jgi:hypothetical protein